MPDLVLYDGDCGLCHRAVRAILARDAEGRFQFASQSSDVGRRLLEEHGLAAERGRTLVLVDRSGRAHVRSEAALRIAGQLHGPARLLAVLRGVPRPWRDAAYDLVARHRRRLGAPACLVVPAALRSRFLDGGGAS